jgi:hypothetical protein
MQTSGEKCKKTAIMSFGVHITRQAAIGRFRNGAS